MKENNHKTPFSTWLLTHVMNVMTKFNVLVVIVILALTGFFIHSLFSLKIDANVFSFASGVGANPWVATPKEAPEGDPLVFVPPASNQTGEEHYTYTNRPDDEKKTAVIPPQSDPKPDYGYYPDGYVILFTSDVLYTPEVMNTIDKVMDQISSLDFVGSCLSPFDYVTVEKTGSRLSVVPISPVKDGEEWTEEDVGTFQRRLMNDMVAKNYLYSEDGQTIMIYYRTLHLTREWIDLLDAIVDPLRDYGRVCLNGGGLITDRVTYYINKDLTLLLSLCFIIILVVYYLSFKSKRSVIIPASMSVLGIIWTLGTMALAGYKLTIVTILTPCLVLTLGSSYSIHMVSEYFSTARDKDRQKLNLAYAKISKTILSACLTTVVGFLSLLICRTQMFKEFGLTVAIGVLYCAFLSMTYLPAILSLQPFPKEKKFKEIDSGLLMRFIGATARVVVTRWYVILVVVVLIFGGFMYAKDRISFNSNYMEYFPSDDVIVQDSIYFAKKMGGTDPYYLAIKAPDGEAGFFLKPENLKKVYEYEETVMAADPDIVQSLSFSQYVSFLNYVYSGKKDIPETAGLINLLNRLLMQIESQIGSDVLGVIINDDASQVTLAMRNYDSFAQDLTTTSSSKRIEQTLDYYRYMLPEGTTSQIYCSASNMMRATDMIMEDQATSTYLALLGIVIIASITLCSVWRGIAAIIPVVVGIMFNYVFMLVFNMPFDIVTVGFTSITIGAGVDDALHFLLRYRNNKKEMPGKALPEVVMRTLKETGRPIILTTLAVDAGLFMLVFASYTPIRYFGMMMCVSLTVAMLSTLFILPSVLIACGKLKNIISKKPGR